LEPDFQQKWSACRPLNSKPIILLKKTLSRYFSGIMGKSKKAFIDKKNASTYHLLYRSQRDVGGDGSGTVLWPSPDNDKVVDAEILQCSHPHSGKLTEWEGKMKEIGLVDDYDYEKHLKPITGTGEFFRPDGCRDDPFNDVRAEPRDDIFEVERQLDAIALTPDCMDDDIAQALFGDFEDGDFEELLDDFCMTAAQEPEESETIEFDFDAHINQLIEKAKMKGESKMTDLSSHVWGQKHHEFFSKAKELNRLIEDEAFDDDDSGHFEDSDEDLPANGYSAHLTPDEEMALCQKFEQTLAEYDSDEVGGLDDECEYIGGDRSLEGDARVDEMLDEYLVEREADFYIDGTRHLPQYQRTGGPGFLTLQVQEDKPEQIEKVLAEAQAYLQTPEMELPPEEILIDGKSYFSQSTRNPWDCESVLSTYSNLDNNPALVERGRRRLKTKKPSLKPLPVTEEEDQKPVQILLSNKTGLPLGVLKGKGKDHDFDYDTIQSVNKGEKRIVGETLDHKKLRKQQVKLERQIARIQKKMMKEAFKDEFLKAEATSDEMAGKSVFRF
jgi:protein LTV1